MAAHQMYTRVSYMCSNTTSKYTDISLTSSLIPYKVKFFNLLLNKSQLWAAVIPKLSEISASFLTGHVARSDNVTPNVVQIGPHPFQNTYAVFGAPLQTDVKAWF